MCMMKVSDHTEEHLDYRQNLLYVYLLERGDQWTPLKEVYEAMREDYPAWEYGEFHDSTARRMITADIQAINENHFYPKMIIQGNRGVKIGTKEEIERYIKCKFKSTFKKLKRIREMVKKANLDGQFQLFEGQFIEAFLKDETEETA